MPANPPMTGSPGRKPAHRVLILGASDLTADLAETAIARDVVERHFAADAERGPELVRTLSPNLVILMGVRNRAAVSFLRRLREDSATRPMAAAVVADRLGPGEEDALRQAGANLVLGRPLDPLVLEDGLARLLAVDPRAPRVPVRLPICYLITPDDPRVEGFGLNLSAHGMLLETASPLDVGTKLNIQFRLPGVPQDTKVVGQVVRNAASTEGGARSGIEFLILRGDARDRVAAYVDAALGRVPAPSLPAPQMTERTSWETELRASELRKAAILDSVLDCILTVDHEGRIIEFNRTAETTFGYSRSEVLGKQAAEVILETTPLDAPADGLSRLLASVGAVGERVETVGVRKDGAQFPMELAMTLVPLGRRNLYTVCLRDITARKRADDAVRMSERQFRALFDGAMDAMVITDREGRCVEANPAALALYGKGSAEVRGQWIGAFADPGFDFAGTWNGLAQARKAKGEFSLARPDGTTAAVEFVATADFLPGSHLVILRDITERRTLEAEFRHAQKMEGIGRLAGGVAHDFNNLLNVISGYSEIVLRTLPPDASQRRKVQEILKAADRATSLTHQLLAFSRKQVLQPKVFDLNGMVSDVEKMLGRLIGEDVDLLLDLDPGLGCLRADRGQIEQVVMNLVVNARDAMPSGGKITLTTRNVDLDEAYCREHPGGRPGRYVLLEVADDGVGMDAEIQRHIFEPFFTTKPIGKGTGLGLATVYGIVKQSEGHIQVVSEAGRGTTFRIFLPRAEEQAEPTVPGPEGTAPARGAETILLLEDEDMVRRMTCELLEAGGYTVIAASRGEEALETVRKYQGAIDLLLTDVVMPGMNGPEVARLVLAARPGTRVLYISGHTDDKIVPHGIVTSGASFLQKPFTAVALARRVRELLDSPAASPF